MATKRKTTNHAIIGIPAGFTKFEDSGRKSKAKKYTNGTHSTKNYEHCKAICKNCHQPYGKHVGLICPAYQKIQFTK